MWGPAEWTVTGNLQTFDRGGRLAEIQVPALFTCGRYDEATPETTAWYSQQLPGSELVVFENSSHLAHLDERERFIQVVRDFLRKVDG
jgi:proline iminopeptidase